MQTPVGIASAEDTVHPMQIAKTVAAGPLWKFGFMLHRYCDDTALCADLGSSQYSMRV